MTVVLASVAFWANATLALVGDLGQPEIIHFKARFKRLKASERKQMEDRLNAHEIKDPEFLDLVLLDWELKDKQGSVVPYSMKQRAELVEDWDGFEGALVTAYFDNTRKSREAAEIAKNSVAPGATTTTSAAA